MTHTLPRIAHEHHERLILDIDTMPAIGDLLLTGTEADLRPRLDALATFLTDTLIPHMEATEPVLYPELERMLQNRHSMTPMRREHAEIRRLVAEYERIRPLAKDATHSLGRVVALRRVVFQLYALLKVHVAEEELYIRIVDHNLAEDASEVLAAVIDTHPGARH